MRITSTITPVFKVSKTQGAISSQGISYNEPGITYNEVGKTYGGYYGNSDVVPITSSSLLINANGRAEKTQQGILDQGITYNEASIAYNESSYQYGGRYGQSDVKPLFSTAVGPRPTIFNYADIYTPGGQPSGAGIHTPMGLLLVLTHFRQ